MADTQYFDVVVAGGGTAGCIVAGRLAERGIKPKTGDRLKVSMIEGGGDWTIRDAAIRPGYGMPIRRRIIANVGTEENGPEGQEPGEAYRWPYEGENYKVVGGCSVHYGGNTYLPVEEDFEIYRESSGVDWTFGKFEEAIDEIRTIYNVTFLPEETHCKGVQLYTESGRAMGFDMRPSHESPRSCLDSGFCGDGHNCRYDAKGTSLPWAYIGLNNGLKVIANAEVEKILIKKTAGAAPVATGLFTRTRAERCTRSKRRA